MHTDALAADFDCILLQKGPDNKSHPVMYFS